MSIDRPKALPLIVGAGPVGLAAGVLLARAGVRVRIVERRAGPSIESRALAVNPRTLELLESTGVTAKMLEMGKRIVGGKFRFGSRQPVNISFAGIHPRYPFMLALSQAATEKLLEAALEAAGVRVERGVELRSCGNDGEQVVADLSRVEPAELRSAANYGEETSGYLAAERSSAGLSSPSDQRPSDQRANEHYMCPWLLAADGAHSRARESLGVAFEGSAVQREWYLADVPLDASLEEDRAHAWLFDSGGFVFCIRVIADQHPDSPSAPLWRVIANLPDPVSLLPEAKPAGAPIWESTFRVEHRIVEQMQKGRIYFAGDAAHVHSPIGARGMNLGIEDAWVFSQSVTRGEMDRYDVLRRPVDKKVVRAVRRLTWMARGESVTTRFLRSHVAPHLLEIDRFRTQAIHIATGLDHPVTL
jgi:2-polyprenyl-6-methoxyphenol hydroxylase-like FAD-dependent oxidoreductase